jgi:hypothetical protein
MLEDDGSMKLLQVDATGHAELVSASPLLEIAYR